MSQEMVAERWRSVFYNVRGFADWTFKFIGWLVIVATLRYAYRKTGDVYFIVMSGALQLLAAAVLILFIAYLSNLRLNEKRHPILAGLFVIFVCLFGTVGSYMAVDVFGKAISSIVQFQTTERAPK